MRGHAQVHRVDAARTASRGTHALEHPLFMTSASERPISPHRTNETPLCTCYVSTNTPLQVGRHKQRWKAPSQLSGSRASTTPPSALSTGGRRGVGRRAPPHPSMFSGPSLQSVSQLKRERDALGAERRFSSMVDLPPRKSAVLKGGRPFCFWTQDPPLLDHSTVGFKTPVRVWGEKHSTDSGVSPPCM